MAERTPLGLGLVLSTLGQEILCNVMKYLSLKEVLSLSLLCRSLRDAAHRHLKSCRRLDLTNGKGFLPASLDDVGLHILMGRCPKLERIDGFHPHQLGLSRPTRSRKTLLTLDGVINALKLCKNLTAIETSSIELLEALPTHFPDLHNVSNGELGLCPPVEGKILRIATSWHITNLHLRGVVIPELLCLPEVRRLELVCVELTSQTPFQNFEAPKLTSLHLIHCFGQTNDGWCSTSFMHAIGKCHHLVDLRLTRVELDNYLVTNSVDDLMDDGDFFPKLTNITISQCEADIDDFDVCKLVSESLRSVKILMLQPSAVTNYFLRYFEEDKFTSLQELHLGFVDKLPCSEATEHDLLDVSSVTDDSADLFTDLFPNLQSLNISNCPLLQTPHLWTPRDFCQLVSLSIVKCHGIEDESLERFIDFLPSIKDVYLEDLFNYDADLAADSLDKGNFTAIMDCDVGNEDDEYEENGNGGRAPGYDLRSDTLEHLTMKNCGHNGSYINKCPNLKRVYMSECRKLESILVEECPSLVDIEINACPSFKASSLARSAFDQSLSFVIIKSCSDKYAKALEDVIFKYAPKHHIFYVMKDYDDTLMQHSEQQSLTVKQLKERVRRLFKINKMLLEKTVLVPGKETCYKLEGNLTNGRYELGTNDPLMRWLLLKEDLSVHLGTACIYAEKVPGNNYNTVFPSAEYFHNLQRNVETLKGVYNHTCFYFHIVANPL